MAEKRRTEPECPVHGRREGVQTRDYCDVRDDFGPCGRLLLYEPELSQVRASLPSPSKEGEG